MRVLVTGANGFIGHFLARELKKRNFWVRSTSLSAEKYVSENDDFVKGNLLDVELCNRITKDIDYVFHMAANIGGIKFISENESMIMHNNAIIDMNMIEASVINGVKRFFYPSSACIYPFHVTDSFDPKPIKEEMAYPAMPEVGMGGKRFIWSKHFLNI